jgi:hypothetical protein
MSLIYALLAETIAPCDQDHPKDTPQLTQRIGLETIAVIVTADEAFNEFVAQLKEADSVTKVDGGAGEVAGRVRDQVTQ